MCCNSHDIDASDGEQIGWTREKPRAHNADGKCENEVEHEEEDVEEGNVGRELGCDDVLFHLVTSRKIRAPPGNVKGVDGRIRGTDFWLRTVLILTKM